VKKPRKNISFHTWTIDFGITTRCTYSSTEQNNKTTKNSSEKEGSANAISLEVSMTSSNLNGVNHAPETQIDFEIRGGQGVKWFCNNWLMH
jgi:subtilisin-like proprotein convertase family protein